MPRREDEFMLSPVPDLAQNGGVHATPTYQYSYMHDDGHEDTNTGFIRESAYRNSLMPVRNSETPGRPSSANGDGVFVRGSLLDRDIEALAVSPALSAAEPVKRFKGRIRTWPGLLLLVVLLGTAGFLISYFAMQAHDSSQKRAQEYEAHRFNSTTISGGANDTSVGGDIVSDDGVIGNPKKYPTSACEMPNYLSKNGHIVAAAANGTEVQLKIKGINWFGMETGQAIPFGLWDNSQNGTTVYQIASFLAKNKFNAVRLPLMASWILENKIPNTALINKQENRAIDVTDYMSLLKSIVKALQYRNIGILLSMHTLTYQDNGKLWYNDDVPEEKFLESIDILTKNLCKNEFWNIMGIDLKNEPYKGTWGDGGATDFQAGAQRIANRMLKGCPKWLGFVEGVNAQHTVNIDGVDYDYYDWYGGGLQGVKKLGLEFDVAEKVVWAPHYYTPAVFPQYYFFGGGTVVGSAIEGYVELDDDALRHRVKVTMDDMFGFLATETGPALLLGEFGGLYANDAHPMKTTQRCTDFTIEIIKQTGWAGGFVWSLNPESEYQYNPADTPGRFTEGVLEDDWLSADEAFLKGMAAMDDMENLVPFPCFPTTSSSSSSAESSGSA
ncbi:hypothetical protein Poli38472_009570 [Pythium oligandrum]|uniref:Glycoside hydrolase family 5 domain-containing protein n=1 Tax=Pythium oligandrum TaxID=41045 RepID=A0A8K1CEY6_PYTOL|nr:hypothetical protein Poli38472_009570 [Pythium oligandrum]|eukprot:TMW62077.1 hypothetical protein Poli38472_009570 [Pythium oligandrum]